MGKKWILAYGASLLIVADISPGAFSALSRYPAQPGLSEAYGRAGGISLLPLPEAVDVPVAGEQHERSPIRA